MIAGLVDEAVQSSKDLSMWIGDRIDKTPLQAGGSVQLAGACFSISLTHHSSISLLAEDGRYVSAFALLRPELDSYLRGLWLQYVATDIEITNVMSGNDFLSGLKLMALLEGVGHFNKGSLTRLAGDMWPSLCDFTHTGSRSIIRHLTSTSIESSYDTDEILEALKIADAWALMAAIGVASLANNTTMEDEMLGECKRRVAFYSTLKSQSV